MKKLLLDTNIVIDLLAKRDPDYADAAQIFSLGDKRLLQLSVSALTIATALFFINMPVRKIYIRNIELP
jgi:predicted nucleic acid-binding protein